MPFHPTELPTLLTRLLDEETVMRIARDTAAHERQRKFQPFVFVWCLLLGFASGAFRDQASFRRTYNQRAKKTLKKSAFQARFSAEMATCFQHLFLEMAQRLLLGQGRLQGLWARFLDVLLIDSTIVTLQKSLQKLFSGTTGASVKLNVVLSVRSGSPSHLRLGPGSRSEHKQLTIGAWVREKLLMLDAGYFSARFLARIARFGGFFLTPLPASAHPKALKEHRSGKPLKAKRFEESLVDGEHGDFEVQTRFKGRKYFQRRRYVSFRYRVVSLWDAQAQRWMCYATNLPPELFSAEEIGVMYRARWLVELAFDELKTGYRLDQIPVKTQAGVEIFIYAALMTLLVSRRLFQTLCQECQLQHVTLKRWWKSFVESAHDLLRVLFGSEQLADEISAELFASWMRELPDPNRRPGLVEQIEIGCFYPGRELADAACV